MSTQQTTEDGLTSASMEAIIKLAERIYKKNPALFEDYYPVAEAANANVMVTVDGRRKIFTLEQLHELQEEHLTITPLGLMSLTADDGEEIEGLDPNISSVVLVPRYVTKI